MTLSFGLYYIRLYISMFNLFGFSPLSMLSSNSAILFFSLSPVCFLISSIASIGVFKLKNWGRFLATTALSIFLLIFFWLLLTQTLPTIFDNASQTERGWFIFYRLNIGIDTFVIPLISLVFLILFNVKVFKRNFVI